PYRFEERFALRHLLGLLHHAEQVDVDIKTTGELCRDGQRAFGECGSVERHEDRLDGAGVFGVRPVIHCVDARHSVLPVPRRRRTSRYICPPAWPALSRASPRDHVVSVAVTLRSRPRLMPRARPPPARSTTTRLRALPTCRR